MRFTITVILVSLSIIFPAVAEDGYNLWLRYKKVTDPALIQQYQKDLGSFYADNGSATGQIIVNELKTALAGLLGTTVEPATSAEKAALLILPGNSPLISNISGIKNRLANLGDEGFLITRATIKGKKHLVVTGNTPVGMLYGTFHLLREVQTYQSLQNVDIVSKPQIDRRILNHWDNLDRTVERGYAGFSLWDWHKLPTYIDPRYHDYARANASIGINGTVVTNVNANALILTEPYLKKVEALANLFRPYGIKIYLTARFSAPIEIGKLPTADPLDPAVRDWWRAKADEIYKHVPDFGGFLVKANSEGQPGPQNYNRSHADGANVLAEALAPHGGIVMWRAFVYDDKNKTDRVKQAYDEFVPLDGKFLPNVIVQVKNGPLDFQPREPFSPLFGAMPKTPLMMEFQITQEYLGFSTHLVYLATMFKETLDSDTHVKGPGSTVAKVVDGSLHGHSLNAIAGVANIGTDRNWTGHHFAQANWYAYGRLAWDLASKAEDIAQEWIAMTFTSEPKFLNPVREVMMNSREVTVNYMTPLGLHHIMGWSHHYGPGPWIKDKQRDDWTSVYYHQADTAGIGFDRTESGSNALEQYHPKVQEKFRDPKTCPEEYLLWFHHVPWTFKTKSGRTLWDEMNLRYYNATDEVENMQRRWRTLSAYVDPERFRHVDMHLSLQHEEAALWRDACVLYFQQFSRMPIPAPLKKPQHPLEYYESLSFPYAPGIRPGW